LENKTWTEFKKHIIPFCESIYLPFDLPDELIEEIIKSIERTQGSNIVFPLVQKVAAKTIGIDLGSVQPLSAPTGQTFYLDYVYKP
jgi:hypothetical protein